MPNSIKKIKFNRFSFYYKELNNLPNLIEILELPEKYSLQIKKIPKFLKKIILSKDYNYIDDFKKYYLKTF